MIDDPTTKMAAYALLGVYVWFMILGPLMKLFTHDPNDKSLSNSRSRWFLQLLIGIVPLAVFGYMYSKQPPPPPKPEVNLEDFSKKIETVSQELIRPKVFFLPYPSTAEPFPPPPPPAPSAPLETPELTPPPAPELSPSQ
jgi:hypothetical protein